ncbi:UNKNOWN [Stylonychia lemnae]|uniref:Uncharacterized protein n=1 Tax=Stylonychia lemnae TaxID=5949 RepID=A0A078B784_STYLE|nr:UNKNOWN [Stylonychia lemnae]|eukprot:CDW90056.1 UNKNOWN [Stylonychia lemnae]
MYNGVQPMSSSPIESQRNKIMSWLFQLYHVDILSQELSHGTNGLTFSQSEQQTSRHHQLNGYQDPYPTVQQPDGRIAEKLTQDLNQSSSNISKINSKQLINYFMQPPGEAGRSQYQNTKSQIMVEGVLMSNPLSNSQSKEGGVGSGAQIATIFESSKQFKKLTQRIQKLRQQSANRISQSKEIANLNHLQLLYKKNFNNQESIRKGNASGGTHNNTNQNGNQIPLTNQAQSNHTKIDGYQTNVSFNRGYFQHNDNSIVEAMQQSRETSIRRLMKDSSQNNYNIQQKNRRLISQKKKMLEGIYTGNSPKLNPKSSNRKIFSQTKQRQQQLQNEIQLQSTTSNEYFQIGASNNHNEAQQLRNKFKKSDNNFYRNYRQDLELTDKFKRIHQHARRDSIEFKSQNEIHFGSVINENESIPYQNYPQSQQTGLPFDRSVLQNREFMIKKQTTEVKSNRLQANSSYSPYKNQIKKKNRKRPLINNGLVYNSSDWNGHHQMTNEQYQKEKTLVNTGEIIKNDPLYRLIQKTDMFDNNQKQLSENSSKQGIHKSIYPKFIQSKTQRKIIQNAKPMNSNMFSTPRTNTHADSNETPRRKFINSDKHHRFFENPTLINLQINNINTVNIERPLSGNFIDQQNEEQFQKSVQSIKDKINNLHQNLQKYDQFVQNLKDDLPLDINDTIMEEENTSRMKEEMSQMSNSKMRFLNDTPASQTITSETLNN